MPVLGAGRRCIVVCVKTVELTLSKSDRTSQGVIDFYQPSGRQLADPLSQTLLVHRVDVAAVRHTVAMESSFPCPQQHANRQSSHAQIAREGNDDRQRAVLVPYVILHNDAGVHPRHFLPRRRGEVQPVDLTTAGKGY